MYKFFKLDLDALVQKRDMLLREIKERGQEIGNANNQSSETWHDNAPLDVAQQEFERLQKRYSEIDHIIRNAQLLNSSDILSDRVSVGTSVTVDGRPSGIITIRIGSYIPRDGSGEISYQAPLAKMLIGSKVGDIVEGTIVNREVEYKVLKIEKCN